MGSWMMSILQATKSEEFVVSVRGRDDRHSLLAGTEKRNPSRGACLPVKETARRRTRKKEGKVRMESRMS